MGYMTDDTYDGLDDLFVEIRLCLAHLRDREPEAVDKIKGLVRQLELWVESLTVDSLRLKSLETIMSRTTELAKGLREKLDGTPQARKKP